MSEPYKDDRTKLAKIIFSSDEAAKRFVKALDEFTTDWGISLQTLRKAINCLLESKK